MPRGPKPKTDRPVKKHISVPESVANRVDLILMDPLRQRTRYGDWSDLVTRLLKDWLDKEVSLTNPDARETMGHM